VGERGGARAAAAAGYAWGTRDAAGCSTPTVGVNFSKEGRRRVKLQTA
jgi:hypothetical protein